MRLVARTRPANDVEIIQIVGLLAQRHLLPQAQKRFQLRAHGADIIVRDAVIIAVKHTGRAALAKQNKRIGQRLEPPLHPALQRLPGLRVVVIHEGDGPFRPCVHQRAVKNAPHVEISAAA